MSDTKVVFLAVSNDGESSYTGEGKTLKQAWENLKDQHYDVEDISPDEVRFFEAVEVYVEVQFVKKEVVAKITKTK